MTLHIMPQLMCVCVFYLDEQFHVLATWNFSSCICNVDFPVMWHQNQCGKHDL